AHARAVDDGEPVEHAQRTRLAVEELGEIRLAQPGDDAVADLDAHLRGQPVAGSGRGEIDLAEAALANEAVEPVRARGLRAMDGERFHGRGRETLRRIERERRSRSR